MITLWVPAFILALNTPCTAQANLRLGVSPLNLLALDRLEVWSMLWLMGRVAFLVRRMLGQAAELCMENQQMMTMSSAPHPYVVVHKHYRGDVSGGSSQPVVSKYVQCPPREYSAAPTAYESPIASAFRKRILLVAKPYQHDNAIEREEFRL